MLLGVNFCQSFLFCTPLTNFSSRRRYRYAVCEHPCASLREFVPIGNQKEKTPHEVVFLTFRDSTLARTARSVIRRENSSTGRVFYTAPTSNPRRRNKRKKHHARWCFSFYGAPSGIRTRDPLHTACGILRHLSCTTDK